MSGVSQLNVQTLKMFAVKSGLSGFKRGLSSGSGRNSGPRHSRANVRMPSAPIPHRNAEKDGARGPPTSRVVRVQTKSAGM